MFKPTTSVLQVASTPLPHSLAPSVSFRAIGSGDSGLVLVCKQVQEIGSVLVCKQVQKVGIVLVCTQVQEIGSWPFALTAATLILNIAQNGVFVSFLTPFQYYSSFVTVARYPNTVPEPTTYGLTDQRSTNCARHGLK